MSFTVAFRCEIKSIDQELQKDLEDHQVVRARIEERSREWNFGFQIISDGSNDSHLTTVFRIGQGTNLINFLNQLGQSRVRFKTSGSGIGENKIIEALPEATEGVVIVGITADHYFLPSLRHMQSCRRPFEDIKGLPLFTILGFMDDSGPLHNVDQNLTIPAFFSLRRAILC